MAFTEQEILSNLADIVNEETGIDQAEVQPEKSFTEEFGVRIPDEEVKNLKTVQDAVSFITSQQA